MVSFAVQKLIRLIRSHLLKIDYLFIWPSHVACGISVLFSGIEPRPLAVKVQSPNHWTAREVPKIDYFLIAVLDSQQNLSESTEFQYIPHTYSLPHYQHPPPEWYICYN